MPAYAVKVENGRVLVDVASATAAHRASRTRRIRSRATSKRAPGPIRVVGISTTVDGHRRPSALLAPPTHCSRSPSHHADDARLRDAADPLRELKFRACEGYYSKSAHACTWPCSITQMDPDDQIDQVYEALVHWADVHPRRDADPLGRARARSTTRWSSG